MKICIDESLSLIINQLQDGVIITDDKLKVLFVNDACARFIHESRNEIIGKSLTDVRTNSMLPTVMKNRKPIFDVLRLFDDNECYCDFVPIILDEKVCGCLVLIKNFPKTHRLAGHGEKSKNITRGDGRLKGTYKANFTFDDIIGDDAKFKSLISTCKKATLTDSPVLLIGESGTGKEVIAQAIHNGSERRNFPFIDINCAALPDNLLESELFGYDEGAFTGAKKSGKVGLFELASGGTLFLDEVTEMSPNLQAKLLRVLQEKYLRKIGGYERIDLNVRIIAATNKNVHQAIENKEFREDLYFRLAVFVMQILPLRDRRGDIRTFLETYINLQQKNKMKLITINPEALTILVNYDWPGNIRELKNTIEYVCNVIDGTEINTSHIPQHILKKSIPTNDIRGIISGTTLSEIVEKVEKDVIGNYLTVYGSSIDNKKRIAGELNISIATLYNKIRKYGIGD
jgi:transcriptional regulator with PAS, ATPase and Fis domain